MSPLLRPLGLVACASLVLGTVAPAVAAPPDLGARDAASETAPPAVREAARPRAAGLIITYADGARPSATVSRAAVEAEGPDTSGTTTPVAEGVDSLAFSEPVSLAAAQEAATELEDLPGVASVEPDVLVTTAAPPALNDTDWNKQWGIHEAYGSQAYTAWPVTTGRVVVGVVDTGQSKHPDLDGKMVSGMDFISSKQIARDGHGRDSNPRDEGDWVTGTEGCGAASPSSWHGTHVAGIIGARANNRTGVAGNAPGVRIQHLRILGRCGGATSDIAAAITWGSGGTIPKLPRNRTPAKVLNLSLSGRADFCPTALRKAIAGARTRGTVVVVAAGNDSMNARLFTPANCPGVVTVGATNRLGQAAGGFVQTAWVPYPNYGPSLDLSAPGGDLVKGDSILSTVNTGAKGPARPGWAEQSGTSMAAPAVSAAAALIASHGSYPASTIEGALRWAVKPFPQLSNGRANCAPSRCGRGILDVSRLSLATAAPVASGRAALGQTLTTTRGTWTSAPTAYSYRWVRNGRAIPGAYGTSYRIRPADGGALIQSQVAGRKGAGSPALWRSSNGFRVPKIATAVRLKATPKKTRYGRTGSRLVARVSVAAGSVRGKVVFRDGTKKIKAVKVKNGKAVLKLSPKKLKRGKHAITATYVAAHPAFKRAKSRPVTLRVR
ncbi:S8 family serine peptidase [Mumia sp. zg.B17]|uniref:S8 family serine peptidase n=1 Tax=unclassified Mumia TaxID=2621872 RepID=UPI001C6F5959|nr:MULTISPECIES: S8 family serine peptidase [unclassified Mumia]MBW9204620.1 S8 family serine peptidase [Mumia sp. zg.B17]MDD9347230.1 S8 family serine peptidase [Mumia sp.]